MEDECFDFELEKDTIVNPVDYTRDNRYKKLKILVEQEFTAKKIQITKETNWKLSSLSLAKNTNAYTYYY